jgi:hypothetical protein
MVTELGDVFEHGRRFAERAGTSLTAWLVGLDSDDLVRDRPDLAVETVSGDSLRGAPCLTAPEVRDFAVRLVRDAAGRVDAVQLESVAWTAQPHARHAKVHGAAPRLSQLALSVCFCPRCRDHARRRNVDADAVAAELLTRWAAAWDGCGPDDPAAVRDLDAYLAARTYVVTDLIAEIVKTCPVPVEVVQFGDPSLHGLDTEDVAAVGATVRTLAYGSVEDVCRTLDAHQRRPDKSASLHVGLSVLPEHVANQEEVEHSISAAVARGARSVRFYHAGLAGTRRRGWLPGLAQAWRRATGKQE